MRGLGIDRRYFGLLIIFFIKVLYGLIGLKSSVTNALLSELTEGCMQNN